MYILCPTLKIYFHYKAVIYMICYRFCLRSDLRKVHAMLASFMGALETLINTLNDHYYGLVFLSRLID